MKKKLYYFVIKVLSKILIKMNIVKKNHIYYNNLSLSLFYYYILYLFFGN